MSAEDAAAARRRIPDDQFAEILRVVRETIRAEMRADREAAMSRVRQGMEALAKAGIQPKARLSS